MQNGRLTDVSDWWFDPDDRTWFGFRCTHMASPWIYDYGLVPRRETIPMASRTQLSHVCTGEFLLTPSVGPLMASWPDKVC